MSTKGERRHLVTLQGPGGPPVPDGDGGFTETPAPLTPPTWWCSIVPATARDLERVTAGTTLAAATHVAEGDYHAGITTETEILFRGRTLYVKGVINPEERNITTIALCSEVVA
jgi:hypothetical protein